MSTNNINKNYINYNNNRIRLMLKRLYEDGNIKKSDILRLTGLSRPKLDNVISGNSPIDIRILLAINELLDEKINWFDLKEEGIKYAEPKEEIIMEEPNSIDMKETEKELLRALHLITLRLEGVEDDVKDLKQTGSN